MASISTDPQGRRTIQFVGKDNKRRTIRLGKVTQRTSDETKLRVERLVAASVANTSIDRETAELLAGVGDDLAEKLAKCGLCEPRKPVAAVHLRAFMDEYIAGRKDVKRSTRTCLLQGRDRLLAFFDAKRALASITPGDLDQWVISLKEKEYAPATISRTITHARQFFRAAIRRKIITDDPFAEGLKPGTQVNKARSFFVTREMTKAILDACPDHEWRLLVALTRYGGVRVPSEIAELRWPDVDWEKDRFRVTSPKTEHHEGRGERMTPIFPELRPFLEAAWNLAEEGAEFVLTKIRQRPSELKNTNLRTRFTKIIRRAGLTPWPRLFQNLRASRETELADAFPVQVVTAWAWFKPG